MNYLTDDWLRRPFDELLAEAERVGAVVGTATHIQRWKPDTCKCVLDMLIDGWLIRCGNYEGTVQETFFPAPPVRGRAGQTRRTCRFHIIDNPVLHFETVMEEVQRKSTFQREFQKHARTQDAFRWSFDEARNLVVDVSHLPPLAAAALRTRLSDPQFTGKVRING